MRSLLLIVVFVSELGAAAPFAAAQALEPSTDAIRVTVSMNADGSRTSYSWDTANHKATATTTDGGKLREKIEYQLDDLGRFATGQVFGPKNAYRFSTRYKYDAAGRLAEEAHLNKEGAVQNRIVYAYNDAGKQTGYSVYDGAGKLLGQTTAGPAPGSPAGKPRG